MFQVCLFIYDYEQACKIFYPDNVHLHELFNDAGLAVFINYNSMAHLS